MGQINPIHLLPFYLFGMYFHNPFSSRLQSSECLFLSDFFIKHFMSFYYLSHLSHAPVHIFFLWHCGPTPAMTSSFLRFLDHSQRRITFGRTPLDEWSARRRDLYRTTHNTHNRQTSMPPVGFKPTISAGVWPQNYAFDRAATVTGTPIHIIKALWKLKKNIYLIIGEPKKKERVSKYTLLYVI